MIPTINYFVAGFSILRRLDKFIETYSHLYIVKSRHKAQNDMSYCSMTKNSSFKKLKEFYPEINLTYHQYLKTLASINKHFVGEVLTNPEGFLAHNFGLFVFANKVSLFYKKPRCSIFFIHNYQENTPTHLAYYNYRPFIPYNTLTKIMSNNEDIFLKFYYIDDLKGALLGYSSARIPYGLDEKVKRNLHKKGVVTQFSKSNSAKFMTNKLKGKDRPKGVTKKSEAFKRDDLPKPKKKRSGKLRPGLTNPDLA